MLQRTPSYVLSLPGRDPLARAAAQQAARRRLAYPIVRWKNVLLSTALSTSSAAAGRPPRAG